MKQEDKELLIKDLCARLPYKVKAQIPDKYGGYTSVIENIDIGGYVVDSEGALTEIEWARPYLFPLSSMTEEQKEEYESLCIKETSECTDLCDIIFTKDYYYDTIESIDYLYKNYVDIRGLIPMGLAIDATGLNIY